jgi:hypothetical protein
MRLSGAFFARRSPLQIVSTRSGFKESRFWGSEFFRQVSSPPVGEEEKSWVWAERSEDQALDFSGEG